MTQPTAEKRIRRGLRYRIQNRPGILVAMWRFAERLLPRFGGLFDRMGPKRASAWVKPFEEIVKKPLFDCQMCGQCILHSTGMTCPMTCPKQLRNGPCGGVRMDGTCEVIPEMDCVWVMAVERSARTPYADEIGKLNPPVDWQLQGTASWVTFVSGRDRVTTGIDSGPHHVSEITIK